MLQGGGSPAYFVKSLTSTPTRGSSDFIQCPCLGLESGIRAVNNLIGKEFQLKSLLVMKFTTQHDLYK
jgi:hypothetical protein